MIELIALPVDGTLMVRISDNVLDDRDWPVAKLTFVNGKITRQQVVKEGLYEFDDLVGLDRIDLLGWLSEDPTGYHPEIYHEIVT